jgi:hypothetical protein
VADLLFDLGNLVAISKAVEYAIPVYELALSYGPTNPQLVARRRDYLATVAAENPTSGEPARDATPVIMRGATIIIASGVGLCVLIWLLSVSFKRRK